MIKRARFYAQALALGVICLVGVPFAMAAQWATPAGISGPLIVLVAPWTDPTATIHAAGGRVIGPTRAPFGVFAAPDGPGFEQNLLKAGYRTFRSDALVALFCGVPRT